MLGNMCTNHYRTEYSYGLPIKAAIGENSSCQGVKRNTHPWVGLALACFNTFIGINDVAGVDWFPF